MSENRPSSPGLDDDGGGGDSGDPGGGAVCGPIENGIQLQVKDFKLPLGSFTYAWGPTTEVSEAIDWTTVSTEDVQYDHIRCYELQEGDNLSEVVAKVNSNQCAQALFIINTEDSYLIDPKFCTGKEQLKFPILVLQSESGKKLITAVNQYPQNTEAKVSKFPIQIQSTSAEVDAFLTGSDTGGLDTQGTSQSQQPPYSEPIVNGLVLKIEDEEAPLYLTYAWSPTTIRPQPISDWVAVSNCAVQQLHIRCYQLTGGESVNDIQLLVAKLDSTSAVALILINNKDDYQIDSRFLPENEKWEFPILVVKPGSGGNFTEMIQSHGRKVTAKVEVSSIQILHARQTGSPVSQNDKTWNMVRRIEEMLFPTDSEENIVSEKSELFQVLMCEFNIYETTDQSQETEKTLFTLLTRKSKDTFEKDFLFYIAVAHRTCFLKHRRYRSRCPQEFLNLCFAKFEELNPVHVATALSGFLKREDFKFHLGLKETPEPQQHSTPVVTAFWFFEEAFIRLMRERKIKEYRIYSTMLWITTYLSFCAKRRIKEPDEKIWQDYFLKDAHRYSLDSDNIEGLKKALALGQMLKLPVELTFGISLLGELLAPVGNKVTRPFDEQKNTVIAFKEYKSSMEGFMEHVVIRLREAYKQSLQQNGIKKFLRNVSSGSAPQTVKDGLLLLDAMLQVVNLRPLQLNFDQDFQEWLLLLLKLTEASPPNTQVECLQEVLSQRYYVTKRYHSYIMEKTKTGLKRLRMDQFYNVYSKCGSKNWSPEILEEYLDDYEISLHANISESIWRSFFELVVVKFSGAAKQRHLLNFLLRVADRYQECNKTYRFIVDLMKLDVPGLFAVHSPDDTPAVAEFEDRLRGFIHENRQKYVLLAQTEEIMNCISLQKSTFQETILAAVLKELITDSKDLLQPSLSKAIGTTVRALTCDMSWLQSEPSPKQEFSLDFVNACCKKISIFSTRFVSIESVNWVMFNKYFSLITKVGTLFCLYTQSRQDQKLYNALPDVVARNPSSSVRSYFEWIQPFHLMLADWKSRLEEKEANYEEINWYLKSRDNMHNLAGAISASSLVVSRVEVETLHDTFLEFFKKLNQLVLKYVPSDPKAGCCSVISILSEYGTEFPQEILSELSTNIIFPDEKGAATIVCAELPPPNDKHFNPSTDACISLSRQLSLKSLCQLVEQITAFLAPVEPNMDLLVHFKLHQSYLFSTHMHHALSAIHDSAADERTPKQVHIAADHVNALLVKVLDGTATYGDIIVENFKLEVFNVEEEFSTLMECQSLRQYGSTGLTGIKSLLKLIQFARSILMLKQFFKQYDLDCCLNDANFKEICKLAVMLQDSQEKANISIEDAKQKWEIVHKALCLKEDASPKRLELFSKVADSADFYNFLKEKNMVGPLGYAEFHHKVEVITRHLELDEHQQMVLNHLIAAFTFIAPIMDPSHKSFHSLMSAVAALEIPEGLPQLETVRKNMHLIQFWFSHSEDTPENVSNELNGILESGSYHYETTDATVTRHSRLQLVLKYKLSFVHVSPTVSQDQSTPEVQEQARQEVAKFQDRTLTMEKIEDFVHRLELLKGDDQNVKSFLQWNEVAYKILVVFRKLQELGHPKLSQRPFKYTLDCSTLLPVKKQEASATNSILEDWKDKVGNWMKKVENLLNSNKWLLFFRVPKLILLYEALTAEKPSVPAIIQEIGFLFQRNAHANEGFRSAVEIAVETCKQGSQSERSPMEIVGSFLDLRYLFDQVEVKKWSLPVRYNKEYASLSQANNVLYNATGYTESELVRLILGLYGGPPEAFEFLHCEPTTTEQDLRLLMKRAVQHPRLYLLAEVNDLPYQLQEILLQLLLQLKNQQTCVYFIETAPSLLREVSYLKFIDYKEEVSMDMSKARKEMGLQRQEDWSCIELVYGMPGNGKTHYIRDKLKAIPENHRVTISINEAFTSVSAIERLRTLPRDARNCAIFFNFTVLPPMDGTDAREKEHYQQLMKNVRWFFFELLILGYVEDSATGLSFHYPAGLSWALYTEVPSRSTKTPAHFLKCFEEEVPALALMGTPVDIDLKHDYCIDDNVQLVCKYLRSYEKGTIDSLHDRQGDDPIKFSTDPRVPDTECKRLLQKYMSDHVKSTKITQKLFIQYMKRRCTFLDNFPGFNYNTGYGEYIIVDGKRQRTDTHRLGSTLMQTMLKEVTDFCDPSIKESWSQKAHQQLIYDFKDGGGSFGLICLLPDDPKLQADKGRFKRMGVEIPSLEDLYSRAVLDKYLSRALGVPLPKDGRLSPIDERQYVLTLDYTLKMLNIHERYECGVPVIIEGETGVGKTALIEMLSELWNHSWFAEWNRDKDRIVDLMHRKMGELESGAVDESLQQECVVALSKLGDGHMVTEDMWNTIAQLPDSRFESGQFYSKLNQSLLKLEGDLKFAMLNLKLNDGEELVDVFTAIKTQQCSKTTAHLLYIIFSATVKSTFHKKNIHADLQPMDIEEFFAEVILQADELQQAYDAARRLQQLRVPFVTAYLDEINTASCLGLFKEIIVDRTINGKRIPENVFIIASCNPHRGDVLTLMHDKHYESWLKGTYYVRKLHPTLEYLKWDYGSLNQQQETEYVNAKLKMLSQQSLSRQDDIVSSLSAVIVESQQKMRDYALEQLQSLDIPASADQLKCCAKSSVSQRDIQRVFIFYQWLMKTYVRFNPHNEPREKYHRRAVLVSLGIVYFMRLNSKYRSKYWLFLDKYDQLQSDVTFSKAYKDELRWYINAVELPPNIAKTEALMENVFATIACTMTRTSLIIVGDPGSSKTLSFNIVAANLKGKASKKEIYRHTDIFQSLDPHFYQCSRRTTSTEVEKTFKKAITRQHSVAKSRLPIRCVVFMDEAGLPEEKLESLKVLHYYLDKPEVSFVAISNHILDTSKTNRAVSLFRPKPTYQELHQLAKASIFPREQVASMSEEKLLSHFCESYIAVVHHEKLQKLFGLRDFIHFVVYLRCNRKYRLNAQIIAEALERNFNGGENFEDILKIFFEKVPASISKERIRFQSILDILKDSQGEHTISEEDDVHKNIQSEVRYKLIIDPSEDDSLVRLLFTYGVLRRKDTRLFICSDFTGDSQSRVNTVVQIMSSVAAGHTVLMCQTDEIHESFYDLFNQRFSSIKDPKHGTRFYTNIAIGAHSKLCRVNPAFQCIVVIKKSEVEDTPPPFLNRFEKYYLTHHSLLETVLSKMHPNLRILLEAAYEKAAEFISCIKQPILYGCTEETLDSLLLTLLPPTDHEYIPLQDQQNICDESEQICTFFLKLLLKMLRENAGFHIPKLLAAEVEEDAIYIFEMVMQNSEFKRSLEGITHENIAAVIDEALDLLHQTTNFQVHTDALIVIAVLMQWFVSYLCKKVMQLVPPEAIPVHCGGIPTMYIRNYLKFQEHFSLKELIDQQLEQLQGNDWDRSVCPTKLLCFTRSSALIHQLPIEYPATATKAVTEYAESLVRENIFTNLDLLTVCKVTLGHSQNQLEKYLFSFGTSKRQVLLLIANMQELTKRMVNHLRIMIEEAESKMENKSKLFVLLLHFPPLMFFNQCYPSIFLQGWSHHYLDAIACGTLTREGVKSVVDIKNSFYHCCFPDSQSDHEDEDGRMLEALNGLLPEAIPIITSRVAFTSKNNGSTFELNASQRTGVLQKFFNMNTGEGKCSDDGEGRESIAQILTTKFCKYWTPKLMVQQIDQVSRSMYAQDSTLNITDSIQSIVRAAFFDFLVYMFTRISEDHIIDIDEKDDSVVCQDQLFLTLLREIRVPELAQLKNLSATLGPRQERKKTRCFCKFPFFKYVCEILDKMIDESKEYVHQQFNFKERSASLHTAQIKTKHKLETLYMEVVMARLQKDHLQGCLGVAVKAMDDEQGDTLWRQYFDDFITYKLDLDSEPSPLTREIIDAYISPLKPMCTNALSQMISLHVCFHVHHLDLTRISSILSQIERVGKEMATFSPSSITPSSMLTSGTFMEHENVTSASPTLGSFIVTMLFDFISSTDAAASESIDCWYRSYRDIMSVPAMVENVMSNIASLPETKLSIMHATYLVMECYSDLSPQKGYQVFTALHSKQSAQCIDLREVVTTGLQTMKDASSVQQGEEGCCLQSFVEGILSLFFSKHRGTFHEEDCKYYLELANKQHSTLSIDKCLSMSMLKLYLARILGSGEPEHGPSSQTQSGTKPSHLELFPLNAKYREMVGLVLAAQSDLGCPGPYIPTFYQLKEKVDVQSCESSKNAMMQQPLAHLYFLTVFERIQTRKYQPTHLARLERKITGFLQKDSTQNHEKILLFIEKQAVVQMLIYEVSAFFDPKDPSKLHSLFNTKLNERVNPLFTDESMGGNGNRTCVSWHALVFAMHLQGQLMDPWELIRLLGDDASTLVKDFSSMKPLQTLVPSESQPKCEVHLFPFLNDDGDLACFYKRICHTMMNVSKNEENQDSVDALIKLAKESYSSEHKMKFTTSYGNALEIGEKNAFRMLLWLCVYNDFYVKKLKSKSLADTLSDKLRGVLEPGFIGLLESFIYPDYMVLPPETSLIFDESAPRVQNVQDTELCHAMANTVAIVLACEPRSSHLWYHMFAADALSGSYMTGFMYPDKISENCLYDCGVELSRDGMYGRPDYLPHATRGTLSLHSLYFILWTNFTAFYMALVTQPDALEKIRGPIISPRQDVHRYCVGQLRNVWHHLGNKLSLSPKEQSFFIMQCMERLLEISVTQPTLLQKGRFETSGELDAYERIWHKQIFEQSLQNIHSKFAEHCHLHEIKLFHNISCLETYYPHFPTMDEFTHTMLSSVDINSVQNKFYVLSIFALEHRRLQAAGSLLPDLLELYHWIHNELAYLVTYEDARDDTIEDVIEKYGGLELVQLYTRVRDGYNSYVEVVGYYSEADIGTGVRNSTKFIDFLSAKTDDDEQWEGRDLLYLIINDIINFHNSFLQRVFDAVDSAEHSNLRKYFPEKLKENVYTTEVNNNVMIIPWQSPKDHEVKEQLQLVRSRYLQPAEQPSGACLFDLHRLQIDVIQSYLAGKPLILQSAGDRIQFRFKIEKPNTFALEGANLDLSVILQGIKESFKLPLEEEYASQLLYEFHSADYQLLAEVVRGLRVATEHLKRELIVNEAELKSKELPEFLLLVFKDPKTDTLEDIGIKTLSRSQLACLQALKLSYLYSTLKLFVNWVKDGMYDFHQLPYVMKKRLEPEDEEALDKLDTTYEGTPSELLQEIQLLTDNLVKSESHLKKTIAKNMKRPIMVVLNEDKKVEKPELIPDTVLCQHYVRLRIMLRRKMVDLQDHRQEDQGKPWVEQVVDLWTTKLKHLWDVAETYDYSDHTFQFDPGAGEYGLYGYQSEDGKEKEKEKMLLPPAPTEEEEKEPEPDVPHQPLSTPASQEQLEEIAEQFSVADIVKLLKADPKLEQYAARFEEEEIDGSILFSCTKETLKELAVPNEFHCIKILTNFKKQLRSKFRQ